MASVPLAFCSPLCFLFNLCYSLELVKVETCMMLARVERERGGERAGESCREGRKKCDGALEERSE